MLVKNMKEFHRFVIERDNFTCYNCKRNFSDECYYQNKVNQYLCGDHIKTQGAYPALKLETDNGRAVCSPCHVKRHS